MSYPEGRWVKRQTERGHVYTAWEPATMPRINDITLKCVVYLYRSADEAFEGINIGGSGFFVSVPCGRLPDPAKVAYAVTNKHVIKRARTLRINTRDGGFKVFGTEIDQWFVSETDDLAVFELPAFEAEVDILTVPRSMFLTEDIVEKENIGIGDEIILTGRFINHEGREKNLPLARFGHISQMPIEPIGTEHGELQDSFLCEVKSIGGFSGSPVFVSPLIRSSTSTLEGARLLGVDWGHIQDAQPACDRVGRSLPDIRFPANTGMMGVVPAWKLDQLLSRDDLVERRRVVEEDEIMRRRISVIALDDADETSANPFHREGSRLC